MQTSILDTLREAKWLPATSAGTEALSLSGNLLTQIARAWQHAADSMPKHRGEIRRTRQWTAWLDQQLKAGAELTVVSTDRFQAVPGWESESGNGSEWRLCWWPQGIPGGKWLAIVSSRLGRRLDQRPEWFAAFRAACDRIRREQGVSLVGSRTTTARFAEGAVEKYGLSTLVVREPNARDSLLRWLRRIRATQPGSRTTKYYESHLSPAIVSATLGLAARASGLPANEEAPLEDQCVIAWADQVFALHLRRGGNTEQLIRARLLQAERPEPDVILAVGPKLVPSPLASELQAVGAVDWRLLPERDHDDRIGGRNEFAAELQPEAIPANNRFHPVLFRPQPSLLDQPEIDSEFLTHCTRRPRGPWPEQSERDYIDELLSARGPTARSAFAALSRILTQARLVGSAAALRGGVRAVSFTAVPLALLHRLCVFQSHRQGWDFGPYGICVRRDWLAAQGAREVLYGDEDQWETLSAADRPFFQCRATRRGRRRRDWSLEREWRLLGDLDLSQVPEYAALVFVPTALEAAQLEPVSRWPVAICLQNQSFPSMPRRMTNSSNCW